MMQDANFYEQSTAVSTGSLDKVYPLHRVFEGGKRFSDVYRLSNMSKQTMSG